MGWLILNGIIERDEGTLIRKGKWDSNVIAANVVRKNIGRLEIGEYIGSPPSNNDSRVGEER